MRRDALPGFPGRAAATPNEQALKEWNQGIVKERRESYIGSSQESSARRRRRKNRSEELFRTKESK
jgi:hypothetical protein